jgi:hypothetical protein
MLPEPSNILTGPTHQPITKKTFLKWLGLGLVASVIPGSVVAEKSRRVVVWTGYVAGFKFHDGPHLIQTAALSEGQLLKLVRQPNNEHDPRAIAIYRNGQMLGYLPMRDNKVLSALVDGKAPLECLVQALHSDRENQPWRQCKVELRLLLPKEA